MSFNAHLLWTKPAKSKPCTLRTSHHVNNSGALFFLTLLTRGRLLTGSPLMFPMRGPCLKCLESLPHILHLRKHRRNRRFM
ncbi:hypothetical protein CPB83DRAFT_844149 [Crepidotus variabilis]|uniref:Uncharacterized protein n=1 Tax=Crepidotus variabilis TaxID=179855 RepID=A0A9P6JWB5_9AGAR|nr:hypothetical protein CPB83DRAFT_844149 [Crepidotus variabilis]